MSGPRVQPFVVTVAGYGQARYFTSSRGKAIAEAWRSPAFEGVSFKSFLSMARAAKDQPDDRFGERITVGGRPAFYVNHNRQHIQFVYEDGDVVLNSHPYDVEPPEARRGTPYYSAPAA